MANHFGGFHARRRVAEVVGTMGIEDRKRLAAINRVALQYSVELAGNSFALSDPRTLCLGERRVFRNRRAESVGRLSDDHQSRDVWRSLTALPG